MRSLLSSVGDGGAIVVFECFDISDAVHGNEPALPSLYTVRRTESVSIAISQSLTYKLEHS